MTYLPPPQISYEERVKILGEAFAPIANVLKELRDNHIKFSDGTGWSYELPIVRPGIHRYTISVGYAHSYEIEAYQDNIDKDVRFRVTYKRYEKNIVRHYNRGEVIRLISELIEENGVQYLPRVKLAEEYDWTTIAFAVVGLLIFGLLIFLGSQP